jgi:UDP-glucose 4-epimerase
VRVLITGSAGNIGREQVKMVREAGHEIRTFDRVAGKREDGWEHLPGDLRDIESVRRAAQGMDAVLHLGAISHDRGGSPEEVLTVNVQGTWNVLLACAEAGVPRVVFYSSVNALGNFQGHRPSEYLPIDDGYPRHPMSPYQLSKHLGEETCRCFSNKHGIVTVCLRPVYVAHPDHYSRWRERNDAERGQWGKNDYWAYVDVRDVCDAGLRGLTVEGVLHDAFLLTADDTTMSLPTGELVDRYYPDTPWHQDRSAYLASNPYRSLVDCAHAKEALGWQPKYSWRDS